MRYGKVEQGLISFVIKLRRTHWSTRWSKKKTRQIFYLD